jgi:hypothetical protein
MIEYTEKKRNFYVLIGFQGLVISPFFAEKDDVKSSVYY